MNVGGALTPQKLAAVLDYASHQPYQIIVLQEVHSRVSPFEMARGTHGAELVWHGSWFFEPGSAHSRGCLMLLKHTPHLRDPKQVPCTAAGAAGRVLRVDVGLAGQPASLVCVYAPALPAERVAFYRDTLPDCLPAPGERLVLMGGDFNCIRDTLDFSQPASPRAAERAGEASARWLTQLMAGEGGGQGAEARLVDPWRLRHPGLVDVTHYSAAHSTGARLDSWLVSPAVEGWVVAADILPTVPIPTDHLPVAVSMRLPAPVWLGKGMPRVSALAYDAPAVRDKVLGALRDARAMLAAGPGEADNPGEFRRALWLNTKHRVMRVVRQEMAAQRRTVDDARDAASRAAAAARRHWLRLSAVQTTSAVMLSAAAILTRTTAQALTRRYQLRGEARLAACALLGHVYWGSTFFFHSRAKPPMPPTHVRELQVAEGEPAVSLATRTGHTTAMERFTEYYSGAQPGGVFAQRPTDPAALQRILASLPSRLTPQQATAAEGPNGEAMLHADELTRALGAQCRGTAPGMDGLTVEFYQHFWAELQPLLSAALEEALATGARDALAPWLAGVLTLVHKSGKPADQVASYRPITLLPVDTRILARAVADRLHMPLDLLVAATQSAFIAGRDISDNIQYYLSLADCLRDRQPVLWALLLDLAGAYDNVDWGLLQGTMRAMGFHEQGHVHWARLMHYGATGRVMLNQQLGPPFPIHSGLLQGSGVSPLYWCIVLHPLDTYLSSLAAGGRLLTPLVPSADMLLGPLTLRPAAPMRAHADDILACVQTPACAELLAGVEGCGLFARAGGPSLSPAKCVVRLVGQAAAVAAVLLALAPAAAGAAGGAQAAAQPVGGAVGAQREARGAGEAPADGAEAVWAQAAELVAGGLRGPAGMCFARLDKPTRYLGTPTGPLPQAALQHAAYGHQPGAIQAAGARWRVLALSLFSRVHVAMQCLAAKVVFQLAYVSPTRQQCQDMQQALRRFVATEPDAREGGPSRSSLHPCEPIFALPVGEGGRGYPQLDTFAAAMQAKLIAGLLGPRRREWQPLLRQQLIEATGGDISGAVTQAAQVRLGPPYARLAAHLSAFARLKVERVLQPARQSWHSVMAEPLLHNPLVGEGMQHLLARVPTLGWRYLRDAYDAWHAPGVGPKPLQLQMAFEVVRSQLPAEWQTQLSTYPPPPAPWEVAELPAPLRPGDEPTFLVRLRDVAGAAGAGAGAAVLSEHWVTPSGRLALLEDAVWAARGWQRVPLDQLEWQPAAVAAVRAPEERLTWEERRQQRLPLEQRPPWPMEQWLLGRWSQVWLDPTVWGWRRGAVVVSLLTFTVREARLRLNQMEWERKEPQVREDAGLPYQPGLGVWPRLWGRRPPAGLDAAQQDVGGIQRLEAAWAATYADRLAREAQLRPPEERDAAVPPNYVVNVFYRPQRRGPLARGAASQPQPVLPPAHPAHGLEVGGASQPELLAARGPGAAGVPMPVGGAGGAGQPQQLQAGGVAAAVVGAEGVGGEGMGQQQPVRRPPVPARSTAAWRALNHPALLEAHRVVAWKALHGALFVGGYRLRCEPALAAAQACCAACAAAQRPGQLETLSHVFLTCPAVQPALQWLLGAYAALAGGPAPPADPLVVLGAAPWVWQPTVPVLWLHMRVAYLGCVWTLRGKGAVTPAAVVAEVVGAMTRGLQRDWRRVKPDVLAEAAGVVPTVWFRGRSPSLLASTFEHRWPPVGQWYVGRPGVGQPVVRLSAAWPVQLQAEAPALPLVLAPGPPAAGAGVAPPGAAAGV